MRTGSRVWPALIESTLNLDGQQLTRAQDKHSSGRSSKRSVLCSIRKIRLGLITEFDDDGVSDIFWVAGGITAVTGFLVASLGLFPRSQVSISR